MDRYSIEAGLCDLLVDWWRLSDIFGRRYLIITGSIICAIACAVEATGQSIDAMIVSGVLFRTGAGFLELAYALVQKNDPQSMQTR